MSAGTDDGNVESVLQAIPRIEAGRPEVQERLREAVEDIPINRESEARLESRAWVGSRPGERDLAEEFQREGNRVAPVASWIRLHLEDVGRDYVYRMYKRFRWVVVRLMPAYPAGDYDSFRQMVWKLSELGLVKSVGTEPTLVQGRPERVYYSVVDENLDDSAWGNPTGALYPSSTPTGVVAALDEQIRESGGGEVDLGPVADELGVATDTLRERFEEWGFDLEARVERIRASQASE